MATAGRGIRWLARLRSFLVSLVVGAGMLGIGCAVLLLFLAKKARAALGHMVSM